MNSIRGCLMLNSSVLIIEPSTSGYELIITAKRMGCFVIVMSACSDERIIPDDYRAYIDQLIMVDTNQLALVCQATKQIERKVSGVLPGFEIYVEIAARVAAFLDVPHVNLLAANALRNKGALRQLLKEKKIRSPQFWLVNSMSDIQRDAGAYDFPLVLKPIDQSGSVHVSKVNSQEELETAYAAMTADTWTEMEKGIGCVAIAESYISGTEYSVEGFVSDGVMQIISVTEKTTTEPPYFVEIRHIVGPGLGGNAICDYMLQVMSALDLNLGVFHAEIKVDEDGPVLIEIAGRLAGGGICELIKLAYGFDLRQAMIHCHLNMPVLFKKKARAMFAGIQYFTIDNHSYTSVHGVDAIKQLPGFHDFQLFYQPGDTVPALQSFLGRVGCCVFSAVTYEALLNRLEQAKKHVRFV